MFYLYVVKGDSGARKLNNAANNFERGKEDAFHFKCADLGKSCYCHFGC